VVILGLPASILALSNRFSTHTPSIAMKKQRAPSDPKVVSWISSAGTYSKLLGGRTVAREHIVWVNEPASVNTMFVSS
jgi:hypothetical protein